MTYSGRVRVMLAVQMLLAQILAALWCSVGSLSAAEVAAVRLTLPPACYAVAGREMSVYLDNIILTETPEQYSLAVEPALGQADASRWTFTPEARHAGAHTLKFVVQSKASAEQATATTTLHVAPADAGAGRELRLLIVGDSLTHASAYPNEVARLMAEAGNPSVKFLGTHRPGGAAPGVAHEGYGGWTWARFATHYNAEVTTDHGKRCSPFVFADAEGKPQLDVAQYFDKHAAGQQPDVVTFLLGINDCFRAPLDDPAKLDAHIDRVLSQADVLIAAFRQAAPQADLALCLTTPPNSRQVAFEANYKQSYTRWGWKRIQHRLVERELQHFAGREQEHLFIVPTELDLDPTAGYPDNNAVHPNAVGYRQIGNSIYAWLKWRTAN